MLNWAQKVGLEIMKIEIGEVAPICDKIDGLMFVAETMDDAEKLERLLRAITGTKGQLEFYSAHSSKAKAGISEISFRLPKKT